MKLAKPSAWLPLIMSLTALAAILIHIARYGITHEADEGATAHIFQILMAGQVPVIAFFAVKWFSSDSKQVLLILTLQVVAALLPIALVLFLKL